MKNCTHLYSLRLNNNTDLRRIKYLASCTELKYLYLDGCGKLEHSDVSKIANVINNSIQYSLDSNYSIDVLSITDTKILNLANQTITKSQFENLNQYVNIEYANFDTLKIVDDTTNVELSQNQLNTLIKSVIPSFKKIKGLSLRKWNISDLSCIYNLTTLRELDVRSTKITTIQINDNNKIISGIDETKLEGVVYEYDSSSRVIKAKTLKNSGEGYDNVYTITYVTTNVTNGETGVETEIVTPKFTFNDSYAYFTGLNVLSILPKVGLLRVSNSTDDFSTMQTALKHLWTYSFSSSGVLVSGTLSRGLLCYNKTALKTLENCYDVEGFDLYYHDGGYYERSIDLDLSKCLKLKAVKICKCGVNSITLPSCIDSVYCYSDRPGVQICA